MDCMAPGLSKHPTYRAVTIKNFPGELMYQAKILATLDSISLKEFVVRAVERAIQSHPGHAVISQLRNHVGTRAPKQASTAPSRQP
jgi:hypothetical protein